jgi:hypothetical protein
MPNSSSTGAIRLSIAISPDEAPSAVAATATDDRGDEGEPAPHSISRKCAKAGEDGYLLACRELWTKDEPRFTGRYVKFVNILFEPKPVQKPHPPVWVGGESGPALRRAAKIGDGWYPIGTIRGIGSTR